ncbi:MAG TPA: DUF2851 family protein [Flavipsychrobacter sp.]|nr:DUF2851 family protein [Flavipsychrobacter sp.]
MNEALLQFIWQFSLYKPGNLFTSDGESVTIIFPGKRNTNAGPDFTEARVKIADTILVGNVELHINSSDWAKHGHKDDPAYHNLILHVVFNNDMDKVAGNLPVLELASHIPAYVITHYNDLIRGTHSIPCASQLSTIKDIVREGWLSRLLAERWEEKLGEWKDLLDNSKDDWRNLLYWRMAANFGFKVNATPFLMLAQSLPLNVLAKHRENIIQLEALLFGQAGMLNKDFEDEYAGTLKVEYGYLRQKYKLSPIPVHQWKFMRLRPANFPTIRIAQFAALIQKSVHLFSQIIETHSIKEITPLLSVSASEYWNTHFRFDELQKRSSEKHLGTDSIHNIIINTIAPIQFLYAQKQGEAIQQEKALQLLDSVPAEENNIIRLWAENNWKANNASQSQSLLQLYNNYCSSRRCLECSIGLNIIRSRP